MTSDTRPDVLALAVNLCPRCGKDGGNLTNHICHTSIGRAVQPNLIAVAPGAHCPTCDQPVRVVSADEGTSHYEAAAGYGLVEDAVKPWRAGVEKALVLLDRPITDAGPARDAEAVLKGLLDL